MIWYAIALLLVLVIFMAMRLVELKETVECLVMDHQEFVTFSDLNRSSKLEQKWQARSSSS